MNMMGNYLDPLGYAFGSGIGQGLQGFAQGLHRRDLMGDMTGLIDYFNQMQQNQQAVPMAQAATNWLADTGGFLEMPEFATAAPQMTAAPVAPPQMRTPQGLEMFLNYQMQQMDPYRQAQIGGLEAQAMRDRAEAMAVLSPSEKVYEPILLENKETKEQVSWSPGTPIPPGGPWVKVGSGPANVININPNDTTVATRNEIERELIALDKSRELSGDVMSRFNPDYLTFGGKLGAGWSALQEKVKFGNWAPFGTPSAEQQRFLGERTAFTATALNQFNVYRKFITGVAAGLKELEWIQRATIDPDHDSPTQFKAKYRAMEDVALKTRAILADMKKNGIPLTPQNVQERIRQDVVPYIKQPDTSAPASSRSQMTTGEKVARLRQLGVPVEEIQRALKAEQATPASVASK